MARSRKETAKRAIEAKKFHQINSHVDAEKYGIGSISGIPLGSFIEGSGKDAKIVAFRKGSTFSHVTVNKIDHENIKDYEVTFPKLKGEIEPEGIKAVNDVLARKLAESIYNKGSFKIHEVKKESREVK